MNKQDTEEGYALMPLTIEPKIRLITQGYGFYVIPTNWFARLFWRFIRTDVKVTETGKLVNLLPRINIISKEKDLGIFVNLLFEAQEGGLVDKDGFNKIERALCDNLKEPGASE